MPRGLVKLSSRLFESVYPERKSHYVVATISGSKKKKKREGGYLCPFVLALNITLPNLIKLSLLAEKVG